MTLHRDFKLLVRTRQAKTGESYTAARAQLLAKREPPGDRAAAPDDVTPLPERVEAVVLKVNQSSLRVRVLGDAGEVTFRFANRGNVAPGHVVTLVVHKRWTWAGDAYASGTVERPRIGVPQLGLQPLPLSGGDRENLRDAYEPYTPDEPYYPLWRRFTSERRRSYEMDPIAWGEFPGDDPESNLTCEAADLSAAGDGRAAERLLMHTLHRDLRCIDAHAHLGNLRFPHTPDLAIVHYDLGRRIAELSFEPGFDGVLLWGNINNRPYLRCLHGYGLCLWRAERWADAEAVFERILSLDPPDNQGIRFCWDEVRRRVPWVSDE